METINIHNNSIYHVFEKCVFNNDDLIYYPSYSKKNSISLDCKVNRIRENAFKDCINLEKIKFDVISTLDKNSFNNCNKLYEVDLGNHIIDVIR